MLSENTAEHFLFKGVRESKHTQRERERERESEREREFWCLGIGAVLRQERSGLHGQAVSLLAPCQDQDKSDRVRGLLTCPGMLAQCKPGLVSNSLTHLPLGPGPRHRAKTKISERDLTI